MRARLPCPLALRPSLFGPRPRMMAACTLLHKRSNNGICVPCHALLFYGFPRALRSLVPPFPLLQAWGRGCSVSTALPLPPAWGPSFPLSDHTELQASTLNVTNVPHMARFTNEWKHSVPGCPFLPDAGMGPGIFSAMGTIPPPGMGPGAQQVYFGPAGVRLADKVIRR